MHPYLEVCCGKALLFIIIATELFRNVKSKRQNGGKIPLSESKLMQFIIEMKMMQNQNKTVDCT